MLFNRNAKNQKLNHKKVLKKYSYNVFYNFGCVAAGLSLYEISMDVRAIVEL